jgi:hypothetical protein
MIRGTCRYDSVVRKPRVAGLVARPRLGVFGPSETPEKHHGLAGLGEELPTAAELAGGPSWAVHLGHVVDSCSALSRGIGRPVLFGARDSRITRLTLFEAAQPV